MAKVLVSIDDELLRTIDARARKLGLTRSAYFARLARDEADAERRPDPAIRRAIERARQEFAAAHDRYPGEDSTAFIRRMRDER